MYDHGKWICNILSFQSPIKSDFALQKTHEIVSSQEVLRMCDFELTFCLHNQSNLSIKKVTI
jgi:hypothetical protein